MRSKRGTSFSENYQTCKISPKSPLGDTQKKSGGKQRANGYPRQLERGEGSSERETVYGVVIKKIRSHRSPQPLPSYRTPVAEMQPELLNSGTHLCREIVLSHSTNTFHVQDTTKYCGWRRNGGSAARVLATQCSRITTDSPSYQVPGASWGAWVENHIYPF